MCRSTAENAAKARAGRSERKAMHGESIRKLRKKHYLSVVDCFKANWRSSRNRQLLFEVCEACFKVVASRREAKGEDFSIAKGLHNKLYAEKFLSQALLIKLSEIQQMRPKMRVQAEHAKAKRGELQKPLSQ